MAGKIEDNLKGKDQQALVKALADPEITTQAIFTALNEEGHRIAWATLQKHRRGACTCPSPIG